MRRTIPVLIASVVVLYSGVAHAGPYGPTFTTDCDAGVAGVPPASCSFSGLAGERGDVKLDVTLTTPHGGTLPGIGVASATGELAGAFTVDDAPNPDALYVLKLDVAHASITPIGPVSGTPLLAPSAAISVGVLPSIVGCDECVISGDHHTILQGSGSIVGITVPLFITIHSDVEGPLSGLLVEFVLTLENRASTGQLTAVGSVRSAITALAAPQAEHVL